MNLVTSIANAARIAEQRHLSLLIEAASLEGQASAAKAAADAKRKQARGLQSIMSRLRGTCHAIEAADPAVIADLDLSPDPSTPPTPTLVDVESAPVVERAAPDPSVPTPDGQAEVGTADADRDADDDAGASGSSDAGLVEADAAGGPDRDDQGEDAPPALTDAGERIMALFERAANRGQVLFQTTMLAEKVDLSVYRLNNELAKLRSAGRIVERDSIRGHVAFELLAAAEAAE